VKDSEEKGAIRPRKVLQRPKIVINGRVRERRRITRIPNLGVVPIMIPSPTSRRVVRTEMVPTRWAHLVRSLSY
jgi:hypothetical protein